MTTTANQSYFYSAIICGTITQWRKANATVEKQAKRECCIHYQDDRADRIELLAVEDERGELVRISRKGLNGRWVAA